MNPERILDNIKKYVSILGTDSGSYFFATQNNELLERKETFINDNEQFEFFDLKYGHKRQLFFKDITQIYLVCFPEDYSPAFAKSVDEKNDPFLDIAKAYVSKIKALDKSIFTNKFNFDKFVTISSLLKYNDILNYYDIKIDKLDKQILFYDEGITDKFLDTYKDRIFDKEGKLKLTLSNAIILSFFDKQTQEYILEDLDSQSRFTKIKSLYSYLLKTSVEKTATHLEEEKANAIKTLKGIEKNYVIQNFDVEINRIRNLNIDKELSYIENEVDLISYWPFTLDLSVGDYVVTMSLEKNKNAGKIINVSIANTPFFNLYKVFKEYTKMNISLQEFEFLKTSNIDNDIKNKLVSKKLEIFEARRDEIFEFLNKELIDADSDDIKNDIFKLKDEINSSINQFKKDISNESSLRDILKYWPVYLYPIPEELVVE